MKKKLFLGVFFIVFCILLFPTNSFAISSLGGYIIQKYDVNIDVNSNNTFDITEKIDVKFASPKHGIFRKIPLKNNVIRLDGSTSERKAVVSKIKVGEKYKTSREGNYKVIQIGDKNQTVSGTHSYEIKYRYNIGKDPIKGEDELYFNIIGTEWDTTIDNATFTINMPKDFDSSTLGFSAGKYGSTDTTAVEYKVDGRKITGKLLRRLDYNEGVTVRLTLPEDYFMGESLFLFDIDPFSTIVILICIGCAIRAFTIWDAYGRDDQVIETIEFYPPDGYTSAELQYFYDGEPSTEGVISLLLMLANEGYIEIEETGRHKFKISKLKEYDGDNEFESKFFKGLFKGKRGIYVRTEELMKENKELSWEDARKLAEYRPYVTEKDLKNKFYKTVWEIKERLASPTRRNKIIEEAETDVVWPFVKMVILLFFLILLKPAIDEYGLGTGILMAPVISLFPSIAFTVIVMAISKKSLASLPFSLIWGAVFGIIPMIVVIFPMLQVNSLYLATYLIGLVCITVILVCYFNMDKRTPYGTELYGRILGFKRFLETAEKPQLESLVSKNPQYFYDILPYTYALKVSDKWVKQFKVLGMVPPNWYSGNSDDFDHFVSHSMDSMKSTLSEGISTESSGGSSGGFSSSGGSSGGGFSGGGSGGGGGGSW